MTVPFSPSTAVRVYTFGDLLASAASVAGLRQMKTEGLVPAGSVVTCVLTGHGLKDPDWALAGLLGMGVVMTRARVAPTSVAAVTPRTVSRHVVRESG